ncbi:hypothetical protein C8035_v003310 [Colletotrichum spinosum]|uniref:Uncharacterized protein n=1 Tax=Colletotrichum spinosum TaxID=1347390 RepID=A0A4R8QMG0_9PEZI|nr:hypothetical protein C8035_v003310 [Colletotrichum spinosum]
MALDKSDTMAVVPSLSAFTDHPPTTLEPKTTSMSKQTSDSVPREPGRPSRFVRQSIPSWLTAFRPSQHANLRDLLHPYPWVYGYTALYTLSTECVRSLAVDEIGKSRLQWILTRHQTEPLSDGKDFTPFVTRLCHLLSS